MQVRKHLGVAVLFLASCNAISALVDVNVAKTECKQYLEQMQNIKCGTMENVTFNIKGDGQVIFYPTECEIIARMSADQKAQCQAIAGKAGDVLTFQPGTMPQKEGVNVFKLGQINQMKEVSPAAPEANNGVEFSFTTAQGLPVKFLVKRQSFSKADLEGLGTETEADKQYKQELMNQFDQMPGQTAILTSFYRQLSGIENTWTELSNTQIDNPNDYQFSPNFKFRVYANGLVALETNLDKKEQTKHLFTVGDFELKPAAAHVDIEALKKGEASIPVGKGKKVTPADV